MSRHHPLIGRLSNPLSPWPAAQVTNASAKETA